MGRRIPEPHTADFIQWLDAMIQTQTHRSPERLDNLGERLGDP
jgi:hypothetical protein